LPEEECVKTGLTATTQGSEVMRLAQFFPQAAPVRIRVTVTANETEETTIEFGTDQEVLFASAQPLGVDDQVHLRTLDGSLEVEARVVAVQFGAGQSAVAARFVRDVPNWIVKQASR
jgi:hypothetical protein